MNTAGRNTNRNVGDENTINAFLCDASCARKWVVQACPWDMDCGIVPCLRGWTYVGVAEKRGRVKIRPYILRENIATITRICVVPCAIATAENAKRIQTLTAFGGLRI